MNQFLVHAEKVRKGRKGKQSRDKRQVRIGVKAGKRRTIRKHNLNSGWLRI